MSIHPTAIVYPNVELGEGVWIGPYAVIGLAPEHRDIDPGRIAGRVIIGAGTIIREHVKMHAPLGTTTRIGANCYVMSGAHIGHDAEVGDRVTVGALCVVGGHCTVEDDCTLGSGVIMHQYTTLPRGCMAGMGALLKGKEYHPFEVLVSGSLARSIGANHRLLTSARWMCGYHDEPND